MLVYAAASAAVAALIKPIINRVLPGEDWLPFRFWAAFILVAYLGKGLGSYFSTYLMTDIGQRVVRDLRNQLFGHILNQSAAFFARRTTGQLMSRITNDVNQVQQAVSETIGDLLREGLSVIGYAVMMFYFDWRLALVSVTSAPLVVYPLVRLGQRVRRSSRRSQEHLEQLSHLTAEAFTGHRIVKAFAAESHEAARFATASDRLYRTNLKVTSTLSLMPPMMEFLGGAAIVGLLWYGRHADRGGGHDAGRLPRLHLCGLHALHADQASEPGQRQPPAGDRRSASHLRDARHAFRGEGASGRTASGRRFARASSSGDVGFAYEDGPAKPILRDVSFTVSAGQMVALVGLSGAGKTTLVNLLPRFYDVTGGAVLFDGIDVRDVTLKSLREQIGIVTQETVLFDDTIANNIAYGAPGSPQAAIEAGGARGARARIHRRRCRSDTRPRLASAVSGCRAGSDSDWRSRERC